MMNSKEFRNATKGIRGVEKKPLPHFLCLTNLLLHGVDRPDAALATNQGFKSLVPKAEAMNEFLYYYLLYAKNSIEENASGTTFKEVPAKDMRALLVPVPPLEEQKAIVKGLNKIFDICLTIEDKVSQIRHDRNLLAHNLVSYTVIKSKLKL